LTIVNLYPCIPYPHLKYVILLYWTPAQLILKIN